MDDSEKIRAALQRTHDIFSAKPAAARGTKGGRATVSTGLRCEYVEDGRTLVADMPAVFGGNAEGLTPGGYLRAGLATCLAIGYVMCAAQRGVRLDRVSVDIEADSDVAGLAGVPDRPVGYGEFRFCVIVESDAAEDAVQAVIDEADARSPVLHAVRQAQTVVRSVTLAGKAIA